MSTKQKSRSLIVCCAFLLLAGFVSTSAGKGQASVLSRVQTIDDPELGELIRVALENLPETKRLRQANHYAKDYPQMKQAEETAKLHTVRLVTEAYVHIKLLDSQIEQSTAKLASSNLPDALAREFFLAKVELESQRATKLAELREIMHIIPRHALGRKPVKDLNDWLRLDVVGDSVLVFARSKPFTDDELRMYDVFVKLMSTKEAMSYAVSFVADRAHHPVRVDIMRDSAGVKFSEELQEELISTIKRAKLELDAEVHLGEDAHRSRERHIYALRHELGPQLIRKPLVIGGKRAMITEVREPIDAEEFDKYVRAELVGVPERLPVKFFVKYDEQSEDLALQAAGTIKDIAKKHGVDKLVEVVHEQWDPDEAK